MSATPLQIVVTAKTSEVDKSMKDIQAALAKTAVIANNADSSLAKFGKGLSNSGSGLDKLKTQLPNVGNALSQVSSEFSGFSSLLAGGGLVAGIVIAVGLFKEWANSITDTRRAQNALNESLNESRASVAGEVASLTSLVGIAQNAALSTSARQQAIDKLNKDYPQYLGNLTIENSNTELVKKAIDSQIQSLIRRAQIKGAENLIEKETERLLKAQTELGIESLSTWDKVTVALKSALNPTETGQNVVAKAIDNQKEAAKSATTAIGIYTKKLNELLTQSAVSGDLFTPKAVKLKVEKPPKEIIKKAVQETSEEIGQAFALARIQPSEQTDFAKLAIGKIDPNKKIFPNEEIIKFGIHWDELTARMKETAEVANSVLTPVFDALFTSIINGSGNAFQSFGNALNQIIKQIAITLLKALALGAILAAITGKPFNIGSIISSSIKGFATGVNNFEGGLALVGERGPELVNLPRGSSVIPNNQIGSVSPQIFIADSRIVGQDIVTSYRRTTATNSRNG